MRGLVMAGSMALAATTLSATAAVPATALALSPGAQACADSDHAADARVRNGSKKSEPSPFTGTGEEYANLINAATLTPGSVTIPTYFHVVLPAV